MTPLALGSDPLDLPGKLVVHPQILTILGTYKCTAACENCCFGSNPYLTQRLELRDILRFIREGAQNPECELVAFSGGECFLLGDDLVTAVEAATQLGLATRCVTNGYWAKRTEHGATRLAALKDAGLTELNISTGDYHQRWVAQETVVNAACLSVELGVSQTVIMVELQRSRRVTARSLFSDERVRGLLEDPDAHFQLIESPWMPMDYRERIEQDESLLLNRRTVGTKSGCDSILRTLVLTPDKSLGFCCGLSRERIPELNTTWTPGALSALAEQGSADFMKIWLFVDGPAKILAWAASKNPEIEWENRYAHHCHACLALFDDPLVRETIRINFRERVEDVIARYVVRLRAQQATGHDFAHVV